MQVSHIPAKPQIKLSWSKREGKLPIDNIDDREADPRDISYQQGDHG
jgi:hypothetical protein